MATSENPFSVLVEKSVSEDEAKTLFQSYASTDGALSHDDLRTLLIDLQKAYHFPPVVPDECIEAVLGELVLNVEATGSVSWIEFKSFFVYLQQQPADHLHEIVLSVFNTRDLASAVVVSVSMPEFKQGADNSEAVDGNDEVKSEENEPNLAHLRDVAINAEFNPSGKECQVFVHFHPEIAVLDVLLIFASDDQDSVTEAIAKDGSKILPQDYSCSVAKYSGQRFPSIPSSEGHTDLLHTAAKTASKGLLLAKQFDEKHKISQTVQQGVQSATAGARQSYREVADGAKEVVDGAKEVAQSLDETMRFSETVGTVTTAISQEAKSFNENYHISETVAKTAQQVDETLHFSENVRQAKAGMQTVANTAATTVQETVDSAVMQVAQSGMFKMGMGFLSGLASTVTSAVEDFSKETMEIVSEQSPSPAADPGQQEAGAPSSSAEQEIPSSQASVESESDQPVSSEASGASVQVNSEESAQPSE